MIKDSAKSANSRGVNKGVSPIFSPSFLIYLGYCFFAGGYILYDTKKTSKWKNLLGINIRPDSGLWIIDF